MEWIAQKDEIACAIFDEYCYQLIIQFFNFQTALDPQRVCIGGGISANPIFLRAIQEKMYEFYDQLPVPFPHLDIVPCKYHNDSNLLGAFFHYQSMQEKRETI